MKKGFLVTVIIVAIIIGIIAFAMPEYSHTIKGEKGGFMKVELGGIQLNQMFAIFVKEQWTAGETVSVPFTIRYDDVNTAGGSVDGYDSAKVTFKKVTNNIETKVDSWDISSQLDNYEGCEDGECFLSSSVSIRAPSNAGTYSVNIVVVEDNTFLYQERKEITVVEDAAGGRVQGFVSDEETNEPLGGVNVEFEGETDTSDSSDGFYAIRVKQDAIGDITFEKSGYQKKSIQIAVRDDEGVRQDVVLTPEEREQKAVLEGTVSHNGNALQGVKVTFGSYSDTTDSSGDYRITLRERVSDYVVFEKSGFQKRKNFLTMSAGDEISLDQAMSEIMEKNKDEKKESEGTSCRTASDCDAVSGFTAICTEGTCSYEPKSVTTEPEEEFPMTRYIIAGIVGITVLISTIILYTARRSS